MGCLKLTYHEKEDFNFFQGLWKKSDGSKKCDNYYPFGLTYNSYSRENSVPNKIKFQGQEHVDDLGLNWDSFKWRNYQPEIGRFFGVDPLADKYVYNSPYAFAENKLGMGVELEGLELGPMPYFFFARPAPMIRPVVETMVKTNGSGRTTGTTLENAARVGRQTHGEELPKWESEGYQTEVKMGEGNRVDGVKIEQNQDGTSTGFVRELKPNTASGKGRGLKQLDRYIDAASKEHPEVTDWQPELTLYELLAPTSNTEGANNSNTNTGEGSNQSDQGTTNGSVTPNQVPAKSDATRTAPVEPKKVVTPCLPPYCT
jgi:RHS repeat-associated protein